ncbi:MAG: hypothetical protein ACLP4V_08005 [Methylocella sp.]
MADDTEKTQHQKQQIQDELKAASVSRRSFIDRIKSLGLGFGAAVTLGVEGAEAREAPDTSVNLNSTNPSIKAILNEGDEQESQKKPGDKGTQVAWYRRFFRRFYRRGWGGGYRRFFRRFYRRW